jgi:hypothetical protein
MRSLLFLLLALPAFAQNTASPAEENLPKVLVIGDSISMNYHESAKSALLGIAEYQRIPDNGGSTVFGLQNIDKWLAAKPTWDVIQFNHGLHDLKTPYLADSQSWGPPMVSLEDYKANLEKEIAILKKTGARLIWCTTTPVQNDNKTASSRQKGASLAYNAAALEVLKSHPKILITDLHSTVSQSPVFDKWRTGNDVHYYTKEEQAILGQAVATTIRKALAKPTKNLPLPGEVFSVQGHTAFVILPAKRDTTKPTPWVWYAPTLNGLPGKEEAWLIQNLINAGIAVGGIDVGESMGNPEGRAAFTAFHQVMSQKRGMSAKPCLLCRSRGGLMHYNWAAEHPESVAAIGGIYPVGNLASWPSLAKSHHAYGVSAEELAKILPQHNPIDRLAPLAKAGIPLMHIHGDKDGLVPLEKNSAIIDQRYRELGGTMTLEIIKNGGHDMAKHWFQSQSLVDFLIKHAKP